MVELQTPRKIVDSYKGPQATAKLFLTGHYRIKVMVKL